MVCGSGVVSSHGHHRSWGELAKNESALARAGEYEDVRTVCPWQRHEQLRFVENGAARYGCVRIDAMRAAVNSPTVDSHSGRSMRAGSRAGPAALTWLRQPD